MQWPGPEGAAAYALAGPAGAAAGPAGAAADSYFGSRILIWSTRNRPCSCKNFY